MSSSPHLNEIRAHSLEANRLATMFMARLRGVPPGLHSITISVRVAKVLTAWELDTARSTVNNLVRETEKDVKSVSVVMSSDGTELLYTVFLKKMVPLVPSSPIVRLELKTRTLNVLNENKLRTIQQVLDYGETKLSEMNGMGTTSMEDLRHQLAVCGFKLSMDGTKPVRPQKPTQPKPGSTSLLLLGLRNRTLNVLWQNKLNTVEQVLTIREAHLSELPGMGPTSMKDLRDRLITCGYNLLPRGVGERR